MTNAQREAAVYILINDDIRLIKEGLKCDDYSFLSDILKGNRWIQYNNLADTQIKREFLDRRLFGLGGLNNELTPKALLSVIDDAELFLYYPIDKHVRQALEKEQQSKQN